MRAAEKLVRQRQRLALLESGGAPDHPINVTTAAVIEPHARAQPCLKCEERASRVEAHDASEAGGLHLRVVRLGCPRCGTTRTLYFRILQPS